ncbi:MAG: potassium-transporting ATPase subunit KdpC [Limisphaerales bacterium]
MKTFLPAVRLFIALTILTGVIYPLLVTGIAKAVFPKQAGGSLITVDGKVAGSELLAQRFGADNYFWARPSVGDDGTNYATVASSASNLGPTSSKLADAVQSRLVSFRSANGLATNAPVPADMAFASGSGLDPHISPEAARLQIGRVATARKFDGDQKQKLSMLVEQSIEPPQLGFLGEPRVNVLS